MPFSPRPGKKRQTLHTLADPAYSPRGPHLKRVWLLPPAEQPNVFGWLQLMEKRNCSQKATGKKRSALTPLALAGVRQALSSDPGAALAQFPSSSSCGKSVSLQLGVALQNFSGSPAAWDRLHAKSAKSGNHDFQWRLPGRICACAPPINTIELVSFTGKMTMVALLPPLQNKMQLPGDPSREKEPLLII